MSTIKSFTGVAEDLTNGKYPVKYAFTLQPKGKVAAGAYILLEIPPEIKPHNVNDMLTYCVTQSAIGFSSPTIECEYNPILNTVKIKGFRVFPSDLDPPMLEWKLGYMVNPRGLITSGMFNVTIYNK